MESLDEGSENIVGSYLRGGKRFLPIKAAIYRLLYCKKETSKDDPYINKALIAKILFEGQLGHLNSYLKDNSLVQTESTSYRIKNFEEMPEDIIKAGISDNFFIQYLSRWEKSILNKSEQYRDSVGSIEDYVEFGLKTILNKYNEFFSKFSEGQLQDMARSIRNREFDKSLAYKIIEHLMSLSVDVEARLILDALTYSTYCLVIGYKLNKIRNGPKINFNPYETVSKIVKLLFESQGDDGAWALRNYDKTLMVKDTSLILYLLKEIHEVFPDIIIDKEKVRKSYSFILNLLEHAAKEKEETVNLETEYLLQVNLYSTVQMIAGYYSATKLLNLDWSQVFEHPFVKRFFKYLAKLESDGGYSVSKDNEPDVETTAFIANTMIGQNSFYLSEKLLRDLTNNKFRTLKIINYFYNNTKAITNFLNKSQHLNIVTDCMSALMWCGVWPLSSQIIDIIVRTCEKARKDMDSFTKIPLFELNKGEIRLSIHLSPRYWNTISAVHVLHQTILCLMVVHNYLNDPDRYWERVTMLLPDSKES